MTRTILRVLWFLALYALAMGAMWSFAGPRFTTDTTLDPAATTTSTTAVVTTSTGTVPSTTLPTH